MMDRDENEAAFEIHRLEWDTSFFGVPMGAVTVLRAGPDKDPSPAAVQDTISLATAEGYSFLLWELDSDLQTIVNCLLGRGAIIGDILVTLSCDLGSLGPLTDSGDLETAAKEPDADLPEIVRIARQSFLASRFYQDPHFDPTKIDLLYENWVRSTFTTEEYRVIREKEKVAGFISLRHEPATMTTRIRLVAVAESSQRRGVGDRLVQGAIRTAKRNGSRRMLVGTQITNTPAIRLYERNGFRLHDVKYRLHLWLKGRS